jgi:hypothetical protein
MFTIRITTAIRLLALLTPTIASAQDRPPDSAEMNRRIVDLTKLVEQLQARVDELEAKVQPAVSADTKSPTPNPEPPLSTTSVAETAPTTAASPRPSQTASEILKDTTINFLLDGYYGYNFNRPIGRVNLLRAYDVSSNSFNINQADLVLENAADPSHGKNFGVRIDLQYGQATETLQGNASNELRPDVWRNLFQAYGTYVIPVGSGLTMDFGKWASSLGIEGNYTKDQMNYSRAYLFDFLPFYHAGARFNYKINNYVAVNYWITNGTQATEANNNFKDELFGLNLQPHKNVAWTVNYYLGQEHPDVVYYTAGGAPAGLPTIQGIPFAPIHNAPKGKLHILDSYATWTASPKLTLALEGDYVIERLETTSAPQHTAAGAVYAHYQFNPVFAIAGRSEYLSDRDGLFTGATQSLKETTFTIEQKLREGFLLREEWRRDFSNHPYFLTNELGVLKKEQNTATLGLVWWFGGKTGAW